MHAPKTPYPFQRQVAELLLGGRNVILQAPTGSGKTHAAMLPFLNALEHRRDFPTKCVYSVPMRVLANQFVGDYSETVKRAGRADRIEVAIQTGERNQNPQLDANLIFATIDQTLSSFLLNPYSLPMRRANLNAAAVMASYLVFDEFHLYDPDSTLPTALRMLQMLRGITPFVLMTATFSRDMLDELADALGAQVVPGTDEEREQLQHLESQQKTRRYHVADGPLTAQAVRALPPEEHGARFASLKRQLDSGAVRGTVYDKALRGGEDDYVILEYTISVADMSKLQPLVNAMNELGAALEARTEVISATVSVVCNARAST